MTIITRISTASRMTMIAPTKKPPISPALTDPATIGAGLTLGPLSLSSGLVVVIFRAVVMGAAVVVVAISTSRGQSGSLRVSRGVLQSLSRCRREERIVMEAVPLATQDSMRETRPGALYTLVPMIMAL